MSGSTNVSIKFVECKLYCRTGYFDYEVNTLVNVKEQVKHFTNTDQYIRYFIDYIKTKVIRPLPNLQSLTFQLNIFDQNNMLHRFILTITNMIQDILKYKEKISLCRSIIVSVTYKKQILFLGNVDFTYIV